MRTSSTAVPSKPSPVRLMLVDGADVCDDWVGAASSRPEIAPPCDEVIVDGFSSSRLEPAPPLTLSADQLIRSAPA
jgi:hypothetical protein